MKEMVNRTLQRGLSMLEFLSEHPDGLTLNQIAREMKLPKSTAFNLVHTLHNLKYIHFLGEANKYVLGLHMFEVGSTAVNNLDLSGVIRQYMNEIFRELNETVHCGLLQEGDVLYIDKLESTRSIRMTSHVGLRVPLFCTAMGKAALGAMSDEEVRMLYAGREFPSFTENTVRNLDALLQQLAQIRKMGYAVEREENNENVCCVGVAIRDREGKPQYALSISVPIFRFDEQSEVLYSKLLLRAQAKIERFLKAVA